MQNNINLFQTPTSNIPPSAVAHSILQNTRACSQANGATVPIQSAIQVLVQNPRFQSSTEAHFTATAKGEEPSSAAWALARVGALFDAVYQDCVFTDKDPEIIQSLSREIDLLEQDLKVRGDVPKEEQEFDLECLRQAKNALAELNSMPVVVEKLQPIQDVLNRSNYTLASSNPGEEISAVPHIKTAVDALTALQKLAASLPDDSAAGTLLNDLARKEAKKLEGTLVQWHERSIQARKRLMEEISTAPAETKDDLTSQMESLRRQQKSLHKELKEIADNMPPELATLSHGIQKIVKAVAREYTTVKKNLAGGTSPGLIKRVVHGILVMMQLSQKAIGETQKIGEIIGPTQHQANSVSAEVQQSHDEMMLQDPSNALAQAGPNAHAYSVVTPDTPQLLPWPRRMLAAIDSVFTFPSAAAQEIKIVSFVQERRDDGQQKIDNAVSTLNEIVQQAPLAARELSREIALLQRELIKTSKTAPKDTCSLVELAHWAQEVNDRCYAVERLEHHIAALMSQARDALTVDDVELEKYGKKHANLVKQARLVEGLKLEGINVPLPHGIASDRVEKFLRKHAPEVFTEWEALGNEHAAYRGRGKFLEESTSKTHLINIVKRIRESFQAASKDENLFNELTSTEFSAWLESVRDSHDYLMVRSTGSEDSRQTANAGGNISKAYVSPVRQEFCVAAGEVVASYFEYASLQNRINAGINPFEQELKLAVTAQQLIGEPVGGKTDTLAGIPISLVLFTSEPLYVGNERFRTMRISATYGHGEGVVGEQGIASDTALMLISEAHPDRLYVLYDNKEKPQRLAPVETPEGIKLQPVSNPSSLRKQPALNAELLSRLYLYMGRSRRKVL